MFKFPSFLVSFTRRRVMMYVLILCLVVATVTYLRRRQAQTQRDIRTTVHRLREEAERVAACRQEHVSRQRADHLRDLQRAAHEDDPWKGLLRLARAYKFGQHGVMRPNQEAAAACLRCALFTSTDPDTRSKARTLLFTPDVEDVDIDHRMPTAPFDFAQTCIRRAQNIAGPNRITQAPRPEIRDLPLVAVIDSDTQNSHDHGVSTGVRNTLSTLVDPMCDHTDDALSYVASDECRVSNDAKAKAIMAIDSLRQTVDSPYTGMSEVDVLARVWHACIHKDNLVLQLASCIEHGAPVCHSGKVARMVASLETDTPIAVPMWAVRQELFGMASKVRRDVLEGIDTESLQLYEQGHHPALSEKITETFKRDVDQRDFHIDPAMKRSIVDEITSAF
jgi:hypothetical protein